MISLYDALHERHEKIHADIQSRRKVVKNPKGEIADPVLIRLLRLLGEIRARRQAVFELLPKTVQKGITKRQKFPAEGLPSILAKIMGSKQKNR